MAPGNETHPGPEEAYQYPSGHLGNLNDSQKRALDEFKKFCGQKGYYSPTGHDGGPTHDDETLL